MHILTRLCGDAGNRKEPETTITPTAPPDMPMKRKISPASHLPMHVPANLNLSGRISPINSMGGTDTQLRCDS